MCHDSVSCQHWLGAQAFPVLRRDNEFVGQHFDVNDQPVDSDNVLFWNTSYTQPDCVFVKNTGFTEAAVKAVIRHRVVLWSQDYHITPLMDIKSLLGPIGVKVVDQSLSYQCSKVSTCAICVVQMMTVFSAFILILWQPLAAICKGFPLV